MRALEYWAPSFLGFAKIGKVPVKKKLTYQVARSGLLNGEDKHPHRTGATLHLNSYSYVADLTDRIATNSARTTAFKNV